MVKALLTLFLVSATISFCSAQQIETQKVFGGYKFTQNGETLKMGDLISTMKVNPQAFAFIKKAQTNNTVGSIFAYAGGALIGFPLGRAIAGGDANWTLAGIGAGLVAISIPFSSAANKNAKKAVELYNGNASEDSEEMESGYNFKPELRFIANGQSIGLVMNF